MTQKMAERMSCVGTNGSKKKEREQGKISHIIVRILISTIEKMRLDNDQPNISNTRTHFVYLAEEKTLDQ